MRTLLNNTKTIDDYLLGRILPCDAAIFKVDMLLDIDLAYNVQYQRRTCSFIKDYGCQHIKAEIAAVQKTLTTTSQHRSFMRGIVNLLKNDHGLGLLIM